MEMRRKEEVAQDRCHLLSCEVSGRLVMQCVGAVLADNDEAAVKAVHSHRLGRLTVGLLERSDNDEDALVTVQALIAAGGEEANEEVRRQVAMLERLDRIDLSDVPFFTEAKESWRSRVPTRKRSRKREDNVDDNFSGSL